MRDRPRVGAGRHARLGRARAATGSGGAPASRQGARRAAGGTGGTGTGGTGTGTGGTGGGATGRAGDAGGVLADVRHRAARRGRRRRAKLHATHLRTLRPHRARAPRARSGGGGAPRRLHRGQGWPGARCGARAVHVRAQTQRAFVAHRCGAHRGYWCAAEMPGTASAPPSTPLPHLPPYRLRTTTTACLGSPQHTSAHLLGTSGRAAADRGPAPDGHTRRVAPPAR